MPVVRVCCICTADLRAPPCRQYVYETIGHLFDKIGQTKYTVLLMGLTW